MVVATARARTRTHAKGGWTDRGGIKKKVHMHTAVQHRAHTHRSRITALASTSHVRNWQPGPNHSLACFSPESNPTCHDESHRQVATMSSSQVVDAMAPVYVSATELKGKASIFMASALILRHTPCPLHGPFSPWHLSRSHAMPSKFWKHMHSPVTRLHSPWSLHSAILCAAVADDGTSAHAIPAGHTPMRGYGYALGGEGG